MHHLIVLILIFSSTAFALDKIPLLTGKLYVPQGYDSNDLIEVTISGSLPDSCHRNPTYEVEREGNKINIFLYAYYVPLPEGCRKLSVPYLEAINLGMLEAGQYEITLTGEMSEANTVKLEVKESMAQLQDDYDYGNVMNLRENPNDRIIELTGTNPLDCLKFEKLEAEIQKSVIVLRPQFREEGECKNKPVHFAIKYEVPYLPHHPKGILIHVRVMGGRSLNHLYQSR